MTDSKTIQQQMQTVLLDLDCVCLEPATTGLEAVLERIGPLSPDAAMIKRAMDRLDEIAWAISDIEVMLAKADFSFGKIVA